MLSKLEIIINGEYSLWLPVEGVDVTLIRNEFNLLTNNTSENRPLSITETFEVPLDKNRHIFDRLRGQKKTCELIYNDIPVITGGISEYSYNEQKNVVLVTITSGFKSVVDWMGDTVLNLDKIDLSRWNYIVGSFTPDNDSDLLKFGRYNPMDTNTGRIDYNQQNVDDYCKPSINLKAYFDEVMRLNGWQHNAETSWTDLMQNVCILPTNPYRCSSFGFSAPGKYTVPAMGTATVTLDASTMAWNTTQDVLGVPTNGCEIVANGVQVRQPNRAMSFKIKAIYKSRFGFNISVMEGENEIALLQSMGENSIAYETDVNNMQDGFDPITITLHNPNTQDIEVEFDTLDFYNLFSVYETNQDGFCAPQGYMFPVADNFQAISPLELYREFLTLFQCAMTSNDGTQSVDYYMINDIPGKDFEKVDVNPYLFWDGYTILSDRINGLAKMNTIKYNGDKKRVRYFNAEIAPLPAVGTYFESIFSHGEMNKLWGSVVIPALKYKVKQVSTGVNTEYLDWSDVPMQLAVYDVEAGAMVFEPLHITRIVDGYWSNMLTFLSSFDGYNPVAFELRLRLVYEQYERLMRQRNLFFYETNAILLDGRYNVITQEFTGVFLSVR